jgi:hypothetical protein
MSDEGLTLHKTLGDMSLRLEKEIYYVGDVIPIHYSYPPHKEESDKGLRYDLTITSKEGVALNALDEADRTLDAKYWRSGEQEPYNDVFVLEVGSGLMKLGTRISRDVTVTLTRKKEGVVLTEIKKHFLLRQPKYKLIPGALTIPAGNRFNYTDLPAVQLNLPPTINKEDLENFKVELFYLSAQTRGGAIEKNPVAAYDYFASSRGPRLSYMPVGASVSVESHAQEIKMEYIWAVYLYPGIYEFRLIRQGFEKGVNDNRYIFSGAYVVDSVRFEIVHEAWNNALRIVSPENPNVNEPIVLRIDSEALPFKDPTNTSLKYYDVYLYKVVEDTLELDGALMDIMSDDVYLKFIAYKLNVVQDTDIEFNAVNQFRQGLKAGKYIFMLSHLERTVYDILEVDVTGRRNRIEPQQGLLPGPNSMKASKAAAAFMQILNSMYIRVGDERRFVRGDKVPFEAYSQGIYGAKSIIKASLHHAVSYDGPLGAKVKEWDMVPGKKMAWTISEDLPIGEYRLALYDFNKGIDNPSPNKTDYFRVVPNFGEAKIEIEDEREFLTDEKINIKFTYPKSVKSGDFKYTYGIFRKGGFLPGCVKVRDRWGGHVNGNPLDKSQDIAIRAPLPGNYVVRLLGWPNEEFAKERRPVVLAEASFRTNIKWEPGGLSFPSGGDEFNWGDAIPVNVNVREDLGEGANYLRLDRFYKDEPSKYVLETYQLGDVTYGGAHRFPRKVSYAFHSGYGVKGRDQLILDKESAKKLLPPGAYEFRLSNHEYGFIISRIPFKVVDPDSPFPWEGGNPKFDRPSDIEPPRLARGLYADEYLDSANCAALLKPEVEPMTLRFVKWDEGQHKYIPIQGALEFGQSFYIEGKLEKEAEENFYPAEIKGPGGRAQEVILWTDEDDKTVVRSERLYSIWEDTGVEE